MSVFGYSQGGSSVCGGPSRVYSQLTWHGFKSQPGWVEEFINAFAGHLDIWIHALASEDARVNMLDPNVEPVAAMGSIATPTTAPTDATVQDTMLDVLCFALGVPFPTDSNLSVADKQEIVKLTQTVLQRKGTRLALLRMASALSKVAVGWTSSSYEFAVILPDGAPRTGFGDWVTPTRHKRPWLYSTLRNLMKRIKPAWVSLAIGPSQFRAGFSAAGEAVFPIGARLNIFENEHFNKWTSGNPNNWNGSATGGSTITQDAYHSFVNNEFYDDGYAPNACVLDLTGASDGYAASIEQTTSHINNQLDHVFELDYGYENDSNSSVLRLFIISEPNDAYWNPVEQEWQDSEYIIALAPSASRTRYTTTITPQPNASDADIKGTTAITVRVEVLCDGTGATQQEFNLFRVGLYEKFSATIEANGERTLSLPLIDAIGWTDFSRTDGYQVIEPANADRSAVKLVASGDATFPYHPALSGRGYLSSSAWTQQIADTIAFGTDWSATNCTRTANATLSPIVGETSPTAATFTQSSAGAYIAQSLGISPPSNPTYAVGVWAKNLTSPSSDVTVTIELGTRSQAFTIKNSQGWVLLPASFSYTGTPTLSELKFSFSAASGTAVVSFFGAYLYETTSKASVLYPPVVVCGPSEYNALAKTSLEVARNSSTDAKHPLLKRQMVSLTRGALNMEVVPMCSAGSQPAQFLFDLACDALTKRFAVSAGPNSLDAIMFDDSGNVRHASLDLTTKADPSANQVTWIRDKAIDIRVIWSENGLSMSAGSSHAVDNSVPFSVTDGTVLNLTIGEGYDHTSTFDGIIRNVEILKIGGEI